MAELLDIVIDCRHPASLARFWSAALDGYEVAPYDEAEIARLASLGISDLEDDPSVRVDGPSGSPRLWFQAVPEPKVGKNRVHLDLVAADLGAEVARLTGLGATVVELADGSAVLGDPEGNEFCVVTVG